MVLIWLTILLIFNYLLIDSVSASTSITANINSIPMFNGTNFKYWKENVMIVLRCMDLDLTLRTEQPSSFESNSSVEDKKAYEKWEHSNRLSLMIMRRTIPEIFRGTILSEETTARKFINNLENWFAKNENAESSTLLVNLVSIRYNAKGNIREYALEMFNIASKLKELKLELSEDLLVHLV